MKRRRRDELGTHVAYLLFAGVVAAWDCYWQTRCCMLPTYLRTYLACCSAHLLSGPGSPRLLLFAALLLSTYLSVGLSSCCRRRLLRVGVANDTLLTCLHVAFGNIVDEPVKKQGDFCFF